MKIVVDESNQLITWVLTLGAGSIAAMVSTSFIHPPRRARYIYLLFLPGWLFLGLSIFFGKRVIGHYMAALLGREEYHRDIAKAINKAFACQQDMLYVGLAFFALWLIFFLFWWVFFAPISSRRS